MTVEKRHRITNKLYIKQNLNSLLESDSHVGDQINKSPRGALRW
jgi:hypothetical protein